MRIIKTICALSLMGVVGCSSALVATDQLPFPMDSAPARVERLWSKKLPGFITDLSIARQKGEILVTTRPDPDNSQAPNRYEIALFNPKGKKLWAHPLKRQIKSQQIAVDGSLAVYVTYEPQMTAVDASGKALWSADTDCSPIVLASLKQVLCFHDDDSDPAVAFDVYDWTGKKTSSFPTGRGDTLYMKVSSDERNAALGLTGGRVVLVKSPYTSASWQSRVGGEIVDVAVSSGPKPQVAVLYDQKGSGERFALLGPDGKSLGTAPVSVHVSQLELNSKGTDAFAYGNGPQGQNLIAYTTSGAPKLNWKRSDPRFADYASPMVLTDDLAIIGFENYSNNTRHSHLLAFTPQGTLKWNIPLQTNEGAYLYAQAFSPEKAVLGVATDDSRLEAFGIEPKR